ncbi:MAG TPA: hypothetical protein VGR14_17880 [Verrucomicrobiae bacterium]|jgi:hypothetical protein|nr:hypothetical protein [Verrucomicrobiae bacterium]
MNSCGQFLNPIKLHMRKHWLWLWLLPVLLSRLLVSLARPSGGAAIWVEIAIICLCSCFFSFALAIKSFSTFQERFWGGLFFSGGSLCLISSMLFLGCFGPTAAQVRKQGLQRKMQTLKQIVPRDAQADATMLDLTPFYDELLPGQTVWKPAGFRGLEPGTHTWEGIKFDVRGLIMTRDLFDGKFNSISIPVGQKCAGMAFLHGAYVFNVTNCSSQFVIHFANGHTETIPLVLGQDFAASRFGWNQAARNMSLTNAVVWSETVNTNGTPKADMRFFIKKWNNPFPGETVTTIDLGTGSAGLNPFLVAITIRSVNP